MTLQRVEDNTDYARVDGGYIINTNSRKYKEALDRRKRLDSLNSIDERVSALESKLDTIIKLLTPGE